jgi:rhodanese-related sulfurtransferase
MLPMIVGSYVNPADHIVLVCEPARAAEIITDLVRIGYDHWLAAVPPDALAHATTCVPSRDMTVQQAAEARSGMFVLDVRGSTEHALDGIAGSLNIPYTRLATRLADLPRDKPILVHCALGGRSAAATAMLQRLGLDVTNMAGGFEAWRKAGLPTRGSAAAGSLAGG